jgi:hypothetical protein
MDATEDQHLRLLLRLLNGIKEYEPLVEDRSRGIVVQRASSLWADDQKTFPHNLSHGVQHALSVSVDHLVCLRATVRQFDHKGRPAHVIHMNAQYSLARGALENAARALWLVDPGNRLERITRRLRLSYKELSDSYSVRELLDAPSTRTLKERQGQLLALLVAAGVPEDQAPKTIKQGPMYADILSDAGGRLRVGARPELGPVVCKGLWKACSALAHGDQLGAVNFLDREELRNDGDVALVAFTGSIPLLAQATYVAVRIIERSFEVFRLRATAP